MSAESPGDVVFRLLVFGVGEDFLCRADLDDAAFVEKCRHVGDARGLLHVVRDDDDREACAETRHQFFDLQRADGIDCARGFVHQQDFGFGCDCAGDAEALLLSARKGRAGFVELVLDFVPECRAFKRFLDTVCDFGSAHREVEAERIGDIVEDAHREGCRLLEDHADATAQVEKVDVGCEDVLSVEQDLACCALAAMKFVDAVVDAQMG